MIVVFENVIVKGQGQLVLLPIGGIFRGIDSLFHEKRILVFRSDCQVKTAGCPYI